MRLRLGGLSDADVTEFVRRAGGRRRRAAPELAEAIGELTDGNAFLRLRAVARAGRDRSRRGGRRPIRLTRSLERAGHARQRARGRQPAALAPGAEDHRRARADGRGRRRSSGWTSIRRAAGLPEPELLAVLDEAVHSGMIEELPSRRLAYRFTHELVRRALYDRLSGVRRAELHLRVGEALERADARSGRALADLAHHFAAAAPFDGAEARRRVQRPRGARGDRGAGLRRGGRAAAHRARPRDRPPARRAPRRSSSSAMASHRAGKALDALGRVPGGGGHRARAGRRRAAGAGRHRLRGCVLASGHADQGAVALLEEAAAALGDVSSELRVGLLGGLARALDFQGERERGAIVRTSAVDDGPAAGGSRGPGQDARARPTGRGARARWRRSSRC